MQENKPNIVFKTSGKHHFFGYYDKCPWSKDGKLLLSHEVDFIDRLPNGKDVARIKVFDLDSKTSRIVAETRAWNWQQGSMLQWLGPDFQSRIIFNDLRGGKFVSVIFNVQENREEKVIQFPIYTVDPNGRFALSVNFSRLDKLREGYGYKRIGGDSIVEAAPENDGIFYIDFEKEAPKLILSLADLRKQSYKRRIDGGQHWVDHLMLNVSGKKALFLHRVEIPKGGMYSRLYVINANGSDLTPHPILETMGSHFAWKKEDEFLVWGRPPGLAHSLDKNPSLKRIFAPIYHVLFRSARTRQSATGDSFLSFGFDEYTKLWQLKGKIGFGTLTGDGHATIRQDKKWLLTDTYAGKDRERKLLLYNLTSKKLSEVENFNSMPEAQYNIRPDWDSSSLRCDLHPRWNRDGTQVCIDSVHEGSRQMYVLDVKEFLV